MKRMGVHFALAVLVSLLILPAHAQEERTRPATADPAGGGQARGMTAASQAAPSIASRGVASSTATSAPAMTSSRETGRNEGVFAGSSQGGRINPMAAPDLKGSSFVSNGAYFAWQEFYYNLQQRYFFGSYDVARFYRNREPLLTPRIQKAALRQSMNYSGRMVAAVEELEIFLDALEAGAAIDKNEIIGKAREIRELAKQLRKDPLLSFTDQREDRDLLRGRDKELKQLGLDAIEELRQMIVDVDTQMKGMYRETRTSTISLDTLSQPSFASLSKGIERLSKVIEDSAKRL